ncbi:hypothetical protein TcCL_ESM05265 [Trypanosoma cruzi]|nr:hypothetical protein TcCL_ESM05265 [Trypanosoma cruzi]
MVDLGRLQHLQPSQLESPFWFPWRYLESRQNLQPPYQFFPRIDSCHFLFLSYSYYPLLATYYALDLIAFSERSHPLHQQQYFLVRHRAQELADLADRSLEFPLMVLMKGSIDRWPFHQRQPTC